MIVIVFADLVYVPWWSDPRDCPGAYRLICTLSPLTSREMILSVPLGSSRYSLVQPPVVSFCVTLQLVAGTPWNLHLDFAANAGGAITVSETTRDNENG